MAQIFVNTAGRVAHIEREPLTPSRPRSMTRGATLAFVLILLVQATFFFYVSQHRLVDDDEGYYLLSSRLVIEHKTPYLDFFYQQAPLLPYVFGGWFKLAGTSWTSARVLCALLSTLVGGFVYWHVWRETGKWLAGVCAVVLFASSSLVFVWYPIVKTFALGMLFLFPAYMILSRLSPQTPGWRVAAAGALFALSADTRSYIVGVLPVFLWWLWRRDGGRSVGRMAWFVGGMAIGALPSLILFFASPASFLYNNLGYHAMRTNAGLVGGWKDKALTIAAMLGGAYTGFQLTVTSLLASGLLVFRKARSSAALLALVMGVGLGVISLLPTPTSIQYFSLVMPFLTVSAVLSVSAYLAAPRSPQILRRLQIACTALLLAFVAFAVPVFRQYLFTGRKVPGVHGTTDAANWTLERLTEVSQAVDELAQPGEEVASFFPGYIFATHAAPVPGLEDNFGIWVAPLLSPEKRAQYHLITPGDVAKALAQHRPRLVVVCSNQGEWNAELDYQACDTALRGSGYKVVRKVGDIAFYECCTP